MEQQIRELRQKMETAERELAVSEGSLKEIKRQLQDEYGLKTEKEIEKALQELEDQIESHKKELQKGIAKLNTILGEIN